MTTPATGNSPDVAPTTGARPPSIGPRRVLGFGVKAVAAAVFVGSFGIWAYAYSGLADRPAPDRFDEPAFALAAESICADAVTDLNALPSALRASDPIDRANQIRAATARLDQMVADLAASASGTPRDLEIIDEWLGDWRVMLGDRLRYAQALIDDPSSAQFLITDTGVNERLDRRITRLANSNAMPSCVVPGDV